MDVLSNPIVVALLALLAVPGVTSAVTGGLKALAAQTGIPAQVWVYVASLAVTGVILVTGGGGAPACSALEPAACTGAWLAWGTVNAELARRLYEALFERVAV